MISPQDVRYQNALAAIKLNAESGLLDLTPEAFEFLTHNKPWINTDRAEARRALEAATYGALDFLGLPRIKVPAEFIAGTIALYVDPVNIMTACSFMEGAEWSEHVIQGIERPVKTNELFAFTLQVLAGNKKLQQDKLIGLQEKFGTGISEHG